MTSPPGAAADLDGDGAVGIVDFLALLGGWGQCILANDCNHNGVIDPFDVLGGSSLDCNVNGAPDECDVAGGAAPDCNGNGVPDSCDVAAGTSPDFSGNGVPDECELPNDGCADAVPIGDGATPFVTLGATTDGPLTICDQPILVPIANDVWFVYTPPCTGMATFSLCNDADFDTRLAVYFGMDCPDPLAILPLACSDDAPGCGPTSSVQTIVVQGFPYLLRIGSPKGGGIGTLTVSCPPGP